MASSPSLMMTSAVAPVKPVPVQGISADQSVDPFSTEFQFIDFTLYKPKIKELNELEMTLIRFKYIYILAVFRFQSLKDF